MSDRNAAVAKKPAKVISSTQKEPTMSQDCIRQQNKVKRKRCRNNSSGDIGNETRLFSPSSMSSNPQKTVICTEVPRDESILTMQSGEGQHYERKIDEVVHPNMHLEHHDMSDSSAPILTAKEGSLSHPVDDEIKQMHANSLDVNVYNNQFLKDSLPVIKHAGSSGEGLPYAPENWPSPGDVWKWHVGKRYTLAGFWQDRSVQPPDSLQSPTGSKMTFNSRVSLEQYIRNTFPDADVDAIFASFIWKIPRTNAAKEIANACSKAAPAVRYGDCKAGNEMCSIKAKTSYFLTPATCYICCTEPKFCQYCCCILCSKTVNWICEGYKVIKCEAPIGENFICGHVAHIECALHAYMAGKVGGSIDLDAQYYCRCCDNKTDLLLHVDKIIKVCESIDNRDDKRKVLNLGLCILHGSEKEEAKILWNNITMLMEKLKHGAALDEICKKKSEILEPVRGMSSKRSLAKMFESELEDIEDAPVQKSVAEHEKLKSPPPPPKEDTTAKTHVEEPPLKKPRTDETSSSAPGSLSVSDPASSDPVAIHIPPGVSVTCCPDSTQGKEMHKLVFRACSQFAVANIHATPVPPSSLIGIARQHTNEIIQNFSRAYLLETGIKDAFRELEAAKKQIEEVKKEAEDAKEALSLETDVRKKLDEDLASEKRAKADEVQKLRGAHAEKVQKLEEAKAEELKKLEEAHAAEIGRLQKRNADLEKRPTEEDWEDAKEKNTLAVFFSVYREFQDQGKEFKHSFLDESYMQKLEAMYQKKQKSSKPKGSTPEGTGGSEATAVETPASKTTPWGSSPVAGGGQQGGAVGGGPVK